ncbi:MAG: flagellar biosynthetic protein FliO [Desulfobacter sp.]|nr:MAG: flagellar biosynthetic protein FliO [Desulfobacter sp.]
MSTDADMWLAFARTLGMLFVVLAIFLVAFYLFRRFSGTAGVRGGEELIRVLAVRHLAPKEKLVLVAVKDKAVLVGVTPSGMSQLACMDHDPTTEPENQQPAKGFSKALGRAMARRSGTGERPNG